MAILRSLTMIGDDLWLVAWVVSADGEVEEIDVTVRGAVLLPDDRIQKMTALLFVLSGLVNDEQS